MERHTKILFQSISNNPLVTSGTCQWPHSHHDRLTIPEMPPATKLMPTEVWSFGLSLLSQLFTSS